MAFELHFDRQPARVSFNHDSCLGIPHAKLPQTQPHIWTAARENTRLLHFALERLRGGPVDSGVGEIQENQIRLLRSG